MEFRILGPLEAYDGTSPLPIRGEKRRALLAILLLHANEVVSRERLIDELWGEEPPETAAKSLQMHVSALRKALESSGGAPRVLITAPRGYLLHVGPGELDLDRFERLRADGAQALEEGRCADAARLLREALALWRGPPLAEFRHDGFGRVEADRLEELRLATLEDRLRAQLELGQAAGLVPELETLVAENPLRERLHALLMLSLYRAGRQADALGVYRRARGMLSEELGLEPGRELRELEQAILRQDSALDAPAPPAAHRDVRPFVGRESELATLEAALVEALEGRARLALISGEPGIGKTQLAEELSSAACRRGAAVLTGRAWEAGGAPAYWPWVQALRGYVRERPPDELREDLGAGAAELAAIVTELRTIVPGVPEMVAPESEHARFRLFEATAAFLRAASRRQPLVLVLDDLHAADAPSLLLLRFLARELRDARVLTIAAFRDTETDLAAETAGELAREAGALAVELRGLSEEAVAAFLHWAAGAAADDELAAGIHRRTEGNPLFVTELARLLAGDEPLDELPATVRGAIERRLAGVSAECRDVLVLAAVLGREFDLAALERLSGLEHERLTALLEEGLGKRIVAEVPRSQTRMRFSHALVREALYEALSPPRRAQLHRRAGEALEAVYGRDREPHLAELAHHFAAAARPGDTGKAAGYARRAAERAARLFAHEEGARLYRLALDMAALEHGAEDETTCDLLLALGESYARAGDVAQAKATFLEAGEVSDRLGLREHQARAALGYGGRYVHGPAQADPLLVPLLERALAALPPGHDVLHARLLARLSGALRYTPQRERAATLGAEAVETARRAGDPSAIAYALVSHMMNAWAPGNAPDRVALATEIVHLAEEARDLERLHQGHMLRVHTFIELGDTGSIGADMEATARLTERLRQPAQEWYARGVLATLALLEGRFAEAPQLIERAQSVGRRLGIWNAAGMGLLQRYVLARETQGASAVEALEPELEGAAVDTPSPMWACVRANAAAVTGRAEEARGLLDELYDRELPHFSHDAAWWGEDRLLGIAFAAEACGLVGRHRLAATLYGELAPYPHLNATGTTEVSLGSVERYLGMLAAVDGRLDDARAHLEAAVAANGRMGARPWAARTRQDLAAVLQARGDDEAAEAARAEAVAAYETLGMQPSPPLRVQPPEPARPSAPPASAATP